MKKKKKAAKMTHLTIMPVCQVVSCNLSLVEEKTTYIRVPEPLPKTLNRAIDILDTIPLRQNHDYKVLSCESSQRQRVEEDQRGTGRPTVTEKKPRRVCTREGGEDKQ
jgi:hypothetical protein